MVFKKHKKLVCWNCKKPVKKDFKFCPHCGVELNVNDKKQGLQASNQDFASVELPRNLKIMTKIAERLLGKDFIQQLDRYISDFMSNAEPGKDFHFTIKAVRLTPEQLKALKQGSERQDHNIERSLKLNDKKINGKKVLTPKTRVRRLADSIIYELETPKAEKSKLQIHSTSNGVEILIPCKDCVFVKQIPVPLDVKSYRFEKDKLIIEFNA